MSTWRQDELRYLIRHYPTRMSLEELRLRLPSRGQRRTIAAIIKKATLLGLERERGYVKRPPKELLITKPNTPDGGCRYRPGAKRPVREAVPPDKPPRKWNGYSAWHHGKGYTVPKGHPSLKWTEERRKKHPKQLRPKRKTTLAKL